MPQANKSLAGRFQFRSTKVNRDEGKSTASDLKKPWRRLMKMFNPFLFALVVSVTVVFLPTDTLCQQKKPRRVAPPTQTKTSGLSRGVAAELITNQKEFKATRYKDVPVGRFWYDWRDIEGYFEGLQPLVDRKVLTFGATGKKNAWWNEYFVQLTPEGEKEAQTWNKTSHANPQWQFSFYYGPASPDCIMYEFPVKEKKLLAVTGILLGTGDRSADVEYTWTWIVTEKGKSLLGEIQSDQVERGKASFQLYDDGWRVLREEN
jgi:hypothetical protein